MSHVIYKNQTREYIRNQGYKESMNLLKNMIELLLKTIDDDEKLSIQLYSCNTLFKKGVNNIVQTYSGYKSQKAQNIWYNIYYFILSNLKKNKTHRGIHTQMKILVKQ